jgi:hypothetical protein
VESVSYQEALLNRRIVPQLQVEKRDLETKFQDEKKSWAQQMQVQKDQYEKQIEEQKGIAKEVENTYVCVAKSGSVRFEEDFFITIENFFSQQN